MNKYYFRKLLSVLFLIIFASFFTLTTNMLSVHADEVTTKTDDGAYNYTTKTENIMNITESTTYIENIGYTTRSGTKNDQINRIFIADYSKGEDIKVVTWAMPNEDGTGFTRTALKKIAESYEENHPGYVVLAGINADQYYTGYGTGLGSNGTDYVVPQPYYPMVSGGENWYSINPYGGTYNVVGFKNDGSNQAIVYGNRSIKGLYIHVYGDDNKELGSFKASDLNLTSELTNGQTTVLAAYMSDNQTFKNITKQSDNGLYIVENADLSWVSNSVTYTYKLGKNVNAFFGKGTISKISTEEVTLKKDQFAIETTDPTLKAVLKEGAYVKCQYEYDDGFAGIEEAIGYHTVQRSNGKDCSVGNSYNSRAYPRSIVGKDANGKVYLITCDGKNSAPLRGMYAQESNALMKQYGITDAFQMDGGGSVTSVYRNTDGEIEYANPAVEGSYRYIMSGLFIVMKVPNVQIKVDEITESSAKFSVDLSKYDEEINNAYLKISYGSTKEYGIYYEIKDGKVEVTGLNSNKEYYYSFCVSIKGKETIDDTFLKGVFTTYKDFPLINSVSISETDGKYSLSIQYIDEDKLLYKMYIIINGKQYLASAKDGLATVIIDKDVSGILDLNIKLECHFSDGNYRDTILKNVNLDTNTDVFLNYIKQEINDFLNKALK